MPFASRSRAAAVLLVVALAAAPPTLADGKEVGLSPRTKSVEVRAESGAVVWTPEAGVERLTLTVVGPDGRRVREAVAGDPIVLAASELAGDGLYSWEVRASAAATLVTRTDLGGAERPPAPGVAPITTGQFRVVAGEIVGPGLAEPGKPIPAAGGARLATKDTLLSVGDAVVSGSLCVGFDCSTDPTFSDTTLLLTEVNTRIKFDDTSSAGGYPNNDWEIQANSESSGGGSWLAVNDCGASAQGGCADDPVFGVEAGARSHALWIESDGDIGLGTVNPVKDIDIVTGDTPVLRLDQTAVGGFTPQVWDVGGNEAGFFVRDATAGEVYPFRIRPGAINNALAIDADGDVGVGTLSPSAALDVMRNGGGAFRTLLRLNNVNGPARIELRDGGSNDVDWDFRTTSADVFAITQPDSPTNDFQIANNGNVTIRGTLTTNGPSCGTGCDAVFEPDYELPSIAEHAAEMYAKRYLPEVGPTTPRAPMNLSEKTGGILNELEKAHIYIAQLDAELAIKRERLDEVEAANESLRRQQEDLARQVESLRIRLERLVTAERGMVVEPSSGAE